VLYLFKFLRYVTLVFQPRHQVRDPRWAGSAAAAAPSATLIRPAGSSSTPSSVIQNPATSLVPAGARRSASPPQSVVDPKRPRGDEVSYIPSVI
jgi:hypothetical protein